jgi:hypothetical protein
MRRLYFTIVTMLAGLTGNLAEAGPPSYLLLKRASTPDAVHPGQPAGVGYAAPAHGYAYGWFGVSARVHPERQMGGYRANIDWRFK